MKPPVRLVALLTIAVSCGGDADPDKSAGTDSDSGLTDASTCDHANAPPRALRLLTRREYAHTIDDLFSWLDGDDPASCSTHTDCSVAFESCLSGSCRPDPCDVLSVAVGPDIASSSQSVVIAGAFNDWASTVEQGGAPLSWSAEHNLHWAKLALPEGEWPYKLVIDGSVWITDPGNPELIDDGSGNVNSLAILDCSDPGTSDGAFAPDVDPVSDFPAESRPSHHPFDNAVSEGLVTTPRADALLSAADTLAGQIADAAHLLPCDTGASAYDNEACWLSFIDELALRTWRRPLASAERERLFSYLASESDTEAGVHFMTQVLLSSPHFLYRTELGELQPDGRYRLTAWETASLLSYTLWGTAPDTELLDAAARGLLDTSEGIAAQAGRLLSDPRAGTRFGVFATAWLGVDAVPTMSRNPDLYPGYTTELGQAMVDEVAERAATIALEGDGGLRALLTGRDTLVTPELAEIYGIEAPGAGWAPATVPAERPGVLGTPALLTATAHSDQTSPVRRGLFVRERILCQDLGTPPADAGGVPDVDPDASTRDRFDQHSNDPACSVCHQYIDPVGFGFEHFDSIGTWREMDGAHPVDATGELLGVEGIGQMDVSTFYGLDGLAPMLANSEAASTCFVEMSWRNALGQPPEQAPCAVDELSERFDADRPIRDLLLTLVAADAFVHRSEPVAEESL